MTHENEFAAGYSVGYDEGHAAGYGIGKRKGYFESAVAFTHTDRTPRCECSPCVQFRTVVLVLNGHGGGPGAETK